MQTAKTSLIKITLKASDVDLGFVKYSAKEKINKDKDMASIETNH